MGRRGVAPALSNRGAGAPYAPAVPRQPTDEPPRRPRSRAGAGARSQGPRPPRRPTAVEPPQAAANRAAGGLSGLFRGASSMIGQVSGIDVPARALDRLAASAERAAAFLDRLDAEIGIERAVEMLDRLDHLGDVLEDSHRSLLEIERLLTETQAGDDGPQLGVPITRRRRGPASR